MQRSLLRLAERLGDLEESHLRPEQIQAFLLQSYAHLEQVAVSESVRHDRDRLGNCLRRLGWLAHAHADPEWDETAEAGAKEAGERWLQALPGEMVIHKGVVRVGSGARLETLEAGGLSESGRHNLEALLRHVEVKRKACLAEFQPALNRHQRWLERLDIGVLFSRSARRRGDLRLLNAALKLNDYWHPALKKTLCAEIRARGCICLAEQELSVQEILA